MRVAFRFTVAIEITRSLGNGWGDIDFVEGGEKSVSVGGLLRDSSPDDLEPSDHGNQVYQCRRKVLNKCRVNQPGSVAEAGDDYAEVQQVHSKLFDEFGFAPRDLTRILINLFVELSKPSEDRLKSLSLATEEYAYSFLDLFALPLRPAQ